MPGGSSRRSIRVSLVDRSSSTAGGRRPVPASANGSTTALSTSTAPSTAKKEPSVAQTNAGVLAGRLALALSASPSVPSGSGLLVRTSFLERGRIPECRRRPWQPGCRNRLRRIAAWGGSPRRSSRSAVEWEGSRSRPLPRFRLECSAIAPAGALPPSARARSSASGGGKSTSTRSNGPLHRPRVTIAGSRSVGGGSADLCSDGPVVVERRPPVGDRDRFDPRFTSPTSDPLEDLGDARIHEAGRRPSSGRSLVIADDEPSPLEVDSPVSSPR